MTPDEVVEKIQAILDEDCRDMSIEEYAEVLDGVHAEVTTRLDTLGALDDDDPLDDWSV